MPSPDRFPARSLATFGVSGLLDEKCKVFYYNVFSHRHVGRVSDLLAARLREAGHDELRLRALLLFAVFDAYSNRVRDSAALNPSLPGVLAKPLTLECGIDSTKLAIGISVDSIPGQPPLEQEALGLRLREGKPSGDLEHFVARLAEFCEKIVLRAHRTTRRIEIVALAAIGGSDAAGGPALAEVQVVQIPEGTVEDSPRADEYTELGDLPYRDLLRPDHGVERAKPDDSDALETESIARGEDRRGERPEAMRIRGTTEHIGEPSSVRVVRGSDGGEDDHEPSVLVTGSSTETNQEGDAEPGLEVDKAPGWKGLFKKVWPFSKAASADSSELESEEGEESSAGMLSIESLGGGQGVEAAASAPANEESVNAESTSRRLVAELQGGNLDRAIAKAQHEMGEIKKELKGKRAERWAEGLMSELLSEKARLHEMARKLNTAVRQKEVEFRNKETGLKEEIRRRDEAIRQKDNMVARTKDQVQQLRMTLDRMKAVQVSATDDVHYRQKFNLTQKLYVAAKEENTKLSATLETLKTEATSLRYAAKKADEYKKQYLALVDKSAGGKGAASAAKRTDAEAKLVAQHRKESGELRERLNEVQLKADEAGREEVRLKGEVTRLQAELKAARGAAEDSESGSGTAA